MEFSLANESWRTTMTPTPAPGMARHHLYSCFVYNDPFNIKLAGIMKLAQLLLPELARSSVSQIFKSCWIAGNLYSSRARHEQRLESVFAPRYPFQAQSISLVFCIAGGMYEGYFLLQRRISNQRICSDCSSRRQRNEITCNRDAIATRRQRTSDVGCFKCWQFVQARMKFATVIAFNSRSKHNQWAILLLFIRPSLAFSEISSECLFTLTSSDVCRWAYFFIPRLS